LDTGDIVLFSRPCQRMGVLGCILCLGTKTVHATPWDHIGVVVKDKDGTNRIWEAAFSGVKHYDLHARLQRSSAYMIAVRRLYTERNDAMRESARQYVAEIEQRPYKASYAQLVRVAVSQYPAKRRRRDLHRSMRRLEEDATFVESEL
ncbi:hypothetical protein JKP88DRAFT_138967, partial [Tribonema minus]